MYLRRGLTGALLFGLLSSGSSALAHEELSLHALTVLEAVEPAAAGLDVRVVHLGSPALAVRNDTATDLTVLDPAGRPFLRIGSRGVFANVESRMAYRSVDPASDSVPPGLGGPARWARIARGNTWTWFDPRLEYEQGESAWTIPMTLRGNEIVASGGFEPLDAHGHFVTELDEPKVAGLEMRSAEGQVPALFVRNDTTKTLHVPGLAGEPFLRIGPAGVSVNLMSPTYYTSGAQTIMRVPPWADPSGRPRWKQLSNTPAWAWLERRGAVPGSSYERDDLGTTRHSVLKWATPMRLGSRNLDVGGRVVWIPPIHSIADSGGGAPAAAHLVWLALALVAGTLFIYRAVSKRQDLAA